MWNVPPGMSIIVVSASASTAGGACRAVACRGGTSEATALFSMTCRHGSGASLRFLQALSIDEAVMRQEMRKDG
jgi:hypothetical protein